MKYDFTSIMERSGKDAVAVDGPGHDPNAPGLPKNGFDFIPMWVADMNFPTVPAVPKAVIARANHPAYGYFDISDDYYDAIIRWHETRNGITGLCKEHIGYENGVLGGVISALGSYASPGDAVLLHSPAYIGFTECLTQNGYRIIRSELKKDAQGVFRMDYTDMEDKIKAHHIHVAIICSPHNPSGRVWERRELEQAMKIFEENEVIVISDEIWSDILLNGSKHIPTQSVSAYAHEHTAAFYAPSKTFNLAGLIGSYHIIYNRSLRDRITSKGEKTHYNSINVLSMHALIGAYSRDGQEWTVRLRLYQRPLCTYFGIQAAGDLYAVFGLHRLVPYPPADDRSAAAGRMGRRRRLAGRQAFLRSLPYPDESGAAAVESKRRF